VNLHTQRRRLHKLEAIASCGWVNGRRHKLTTKWTKSRNIRFLIEADFIWCGVGECAGGVAVFGEKQCS